MWTSGGQSYPTLAASVSQICVLAADGVVAVPGYDLKSGQVWSLTSICSLSIFLKISPCLSLPHGSPVSSLFVPCVLFSWTSPSTFRRCLHVRSNMTCRLNEHFLEWHALLSHLSVWLASSLLSGLQKDSLSILCGNVPIWDSVLHYIFFSSWHSPLTNYSTTSFIYSLFTSYPCLFYALDSKFKENCPDIFHLEYSMCPVFVGKMNEWMTKVVY